MFQSLPAKGDFPDDAASFPDADLIRENEAQEFGGRERPVAQRPTFRSGK